MSQIRAQNTSPEVQVRSILHRLGLRFRLHSPNLPGKPDIVLPKYKTVVLVHGCFWHRHKDCRLAYTPKSRIEFWHSKFEKNVERDRVVRQQLRHRGWRIIVVWECEVRNGERLKRRLQRLLVTN